MAPAARQIASLFAGYGAAGLFWGTLAASTPALQERGGLGDAGFGLALGLMALSAFPVMQVMGRVLHRIEAIAMPLCLLAMAAGSLILAAVPGLFGLLLGFAVAGGASGALDIALNNRTARIEALTGARLFNRTHALFPAAMLAASAATGAARDAGGPLWLLFGIVTAGFAASAALEFGAGGDAVPRQESEAPAGRTRWTGPLVVLALLAALGAAQEAAANGWAAIFIERVRDGSPFAAGLAAAAFTLGLSVGRMSAHVVELRVRAAVIMRAAAVLSLASFAAIAAGIPVGAAVAFYFIAGLGVGPIEPAVFRAVATRSDGPERGRALASVTGVAYLGYLLSPPALGFVAEGLGWSALWATTAILAALVAGLTFRLPPAGSTPNQ